MAKKKIDAEYIRARYPNIPRRNIDGLKAAMQKYGDNYWWESEDPIQLAMYQIFEDILMVDFGKFHEGLEKLVGRPVFTHEMGLNPEGLKEEARLGIQRIKKRIGTSEEYKQEAVMRSIKMLEDYCKKTGKKLFKLDAAQHSSERDENGIDHSGEDGWLR